MDNCIFCKIIKGEVPSEIVSQADDFLVIKDVKPRAPVHVLIIPKKHIESLNKLSKADQDLIGRMLIESQIIAAKYGLTERGYKVIINCGKDGGQEVPHLHFHFIGGRKLTGLV